MSTSLKNVLKALDSVGFVKEQLADEPALEAYACLLDRAGESILNGLIYEFSVAENRIEELTRELESLRRGWEDIFPLDGNAPASLQKDILVSADGEYSDGSTVEPHIAEPDGTTAYSPGRPIHDGESAD